MTRAGDDRVTLAQVAQEAGVSLSTVSKVLNGRTDVSASTRSRIEAMLERHGYRRSTAAGAPAPLVEVVFHELDSAWSLELIRGVEGVATGAGAGVVVTQSGQSWSAPGPEWIEGVLRRRPVGVVLVFSDLPDEHKERLAARAIPFAIIDPTGDAADDVPSVGSANWAGGLMATRHLVEQGHRRIAVITGPEAMACSQARLAGYRTALSTAGLDADPGLVRFGDFRAAGGRRHAEDLLDLPERPTAIFAGSDLQALGVLEAARQRELLVPRDLSVVGYDDLPLARWCSPPLTTVHQPLKEMAAEATRLVLSQRHGADDLDGAAGSTVSRELATHLVVRESTAPPRGSTAPPPQRTGTAPAASGARRPVT